MLLKKDKSAKGIGGDYSKICDSIKESGERRRKMLIDYNSKLREPDLFIPDEDAEMYAKGFGIGYWRVKGGIFSMRRMANGFHPEQSQMFSNNYVMMLHGLLQRKMVGLEKKNG